MNAAERERQVTERFWKNVRVTPLVDGCWVWTGGSKGFGYGRFWLGDKDALAHRVAYEICIGRIPDGLEIDHLCRNRACVRPDHLEPVTSRENTMRGVGPSAMNIHKTHCPRGHEYSTANTYVKSNGDRQCRACARDRMNGRRARGLIKSRRRVPAGMAALPHLVEPGCQGRRCQDGTCGVCVVVPDEAWIAYKATRAPRRAKR